MTIDPGTAASVMFPNLPTTPAAPAAAAPRAPAAAAPAPATQAAAAAPATAWAESQRKLENLFGVPKAEGDAATAKPADGAQKPAEGQPKPADGDPAKAADASPPVLDPTSPETAIVAPVAAELGLTAAQVSKLTALRSALQDRQTNAWHAEASKTLDQGTIRDAQRAMAFAPASLKTWLNESGAGNHPGMLQWAANMMRNRAPGR
jgi:hypothetical protein